MPESLATINSAGVPRSQLPQIPEDQIPEFIRFLQTRSRPETRNPNPQASNPNSEKGGNYYNVGLVSDVAVSAARIPVKFLKPVQKHIRPEKAKRFLFDIDNLKETLFIAAKDNEIFDAQHRWAALNHWNKHYPVKVIRVELPIVDLINYAKQFEGSHSSGMYENIKLKNILKVIFKAGING